MNSLKIRINFLAILDFLIVFFLLLDTHSIYNITVGKDYHILEISVILLLFRILISIDKFVKTIDLRTIFITLSWIVYSLVYFLMNSRDSAAFVNRFIILPVILIIYFNYLLSRNQLKSLLVYYTNIVFVIACISLVFWVFGSLLKIIPTTSVLDIQWGKLRTISSYYGLYFQWQNDASFMGRVFFRNIGIFSEAPMYSLHLSLAFLLDYFILKNKKIGKIFLYIVTIVSTYSVTGILLVLMSLVMDYVFNSFAAAFKHKELNIGILFIPLVTIVATIYGYKILGQKLESASGGSRIEDYRIGYLAWQVNPFFGSGFNKHDIINSLKTMTRYSRSATGFTNSPMIILTEGGIYFFICFAQAFIHYFSKSLILKNKNIFIFISMFLYLFLTTTFQHSSIIIILVSLSLIDRTKVPVVSYDK